MNANWILQFKTRSVVTDADRVCASQAHTDERAPEEREVRGSIPWGGTARVHRNPYPVAREANLLLSVRVAEKAVCKISWP